MSALYHDSAAALVVGGRVVAAVQLERLSGLKHDAAFPLEAIAYCLAEGDVAAHGLDAVAYYDKPIDSFSRVFKSFVAAGPRSWRAFPKAVNEWSTRKLWTSHEIERGLLSLGMSFPPELLYSEHHLSHAAAAFYPSPFESAAVLTMDGVGEWATSTIGRGSGRHVELLQQQQFPHSLGLLYSTITTLCGFRANSGEYKLMGLAPFGEPTFVDQLLDEVVDVGPDGSTILNLAYFDFLSGRNLASAELHRLVGPPRDDGAPISPRDCDLARSIQEIVEQVVIKSAGFALELTGERDLVLGGGVALNCVANGRLRAAQVVPGDIWVQPAAGDAGSALGCALWATHEVLGQPRQVVRPDGMSGALLGPSIDNAYVVTLLDSLGADYEHVTDSDTRAERVAQLLADGAVVAVAQGRAEFGPRALGNRSILADPRSGDLQHSLNVRVKLRESFRPFAPAVLEERAEEWFDVDRPSPYMTFVHPVLEARRCDPSAPPREHADEAVRSVEQRAADVRSQIPAVTHVDYSARLQTVDHHRFPEFHRLLTAFEQLTDCPVLVNTSFNLRGRPMVTTAEEALSCFVSTDIDWLILGECLLERSAQPDLAVPRVEAADD